MTTAIYIMIYIRIDLHSITGESASIFEDYFHVIPDPYLRSVKLVLYTCILHTVIPDPCLRARGNRLEWVAEYMDQVRPVLYPYTVLYMTRTSVPRRMSSPSIISRGLFPWPQHLTWNEGSR